MAVVSAAEGGSAGRWGDLGEQAVMVNGLLTGHHPWQEEQPQRTGQDCMG